MSNNTYDDDDFFVDLSDSLGKQVDSELKNSAKTDKQTEKRKKEVKTEDIKKKKSNIISVDFGEGNLEDEFDDFDDFDEVVELEENYEEDFDEDFDNEPADNSDEDIDENDLEVFEDEEMPEKKKKHKGLKIFLAVLGVLAVFALWLGFTSSGRRFALGIVAKFVHSGVQNEDTLSYVYDPTTGEYVQVNKDTKDSPSTSDIPKDNVTVTPAVEDKFVPRSEDYVKTYLIFGIEEIDGASNTDAIMLISINTKDNTIKLTSILRDTYVAIPGYNNNKINSVYSKGAKGAATKEEANAKGAAMLIDVIEKTFDIDISGYASVNFSSFEKIIDILGGVDIELGEKEAAYLCRTNYISNPANRTVTAGWNHLNGNQCLGYVRVRKEVTLGGAANDYGRTVRQRRVIKAVINQYKSKNIIDMISIMSKCLGEVRTNLTEDQITDILVDIVENSIFETQSLRLPADSNFWDSSDKGIFNGDKLIKYTLVLDGYEEANIAKLHQFVFLDPVETGSGQ